MIKWFKCLFLATIIIGSIIAGAIFASHNNQSTSVLLFSVVLPEFGLGLWLLSFLLVGSFIGLLLSYLPLLWGRKSRAAKDRKIHSLEKEINQLRSASLKG